MLLARLLYAASTKPVESASSLRSSAQDRWKREETPMNCPVNWWKRKKKRRWRHYFAKGQILGQIAELGENLQTAQCSPSVPQAVVHTQGEFARLFCKTALVLLRHALWCYELDSAICQSTTSSGGVMAQQSGLTSLTCCNNKQKQNSVNP